MDRDEAWAETDRQRAEMADVLAGLAPAQWNHPSLCTGWLVRHVAAHLTLAPTTGVWDAIVEFTRARGSFDRAVYATAIRQGAEPQQRICADLRTIAGSRRLAPGTTYREPLLDVLVHSQDILIPLGIDRPMPPDAAAFSAGRVWSKSFPFGARRRLAGLRFTATDVDFTRGEGTECAGPIASILLLFTGRPVAITQFTGPGASSLPGRF